jgi:hypothetical protein
MQKSQSKLFSDKFVGERRGIGIIVFGARGRGSEPFLIIEWADGESILFDMRLSFVR